MYEDIGTQGLEGLSQSSYVPGFDLSQTNKDNEAHDWWTPMTTLNQWKKPQLHHRLSGRDSVKDQARNLSLVIHQWLTMIHAMGFKSNTLRIGHTTFNLTAAQRILTPGKWLGNEVLNISLIVTLVFVNIQEMDSMMYMWRENTTLRRWNIKRVAFMSAIFYLQLDNAYHKFNPNKKAYEFPDLFLAYGRGELPSHGRTDKVYGVDIDRLYFPLFVNEIESPNNAEFPQDVIAATALFTSKTVKNPGRLFHSSPMGSEKSVIEEIEDFQELFDVLLIDNSQFQNSLTACETMLKRQESRIEEMEDVIGRSEEKTIECIRELRFIKALFVFCLV
ncbi:LOW QUALITY PROTEIN: hypothetical protein HID58_060948, partial [Brassica napus]